MFELSGRSRRKLRDAKRTGDEEQLEDLRKEVLEEECNRWERRPEGRYGLISEAECRRRAPELVRRAWEKLKEVSEERVQDIIEDYEEQRGGPPQFDSDREVDSDAGGKTTTTWREYRNGFQQVASGQILIGDLYICRSRRANADWVVIAVMKTLIHELLGHWNRIGQRIKVGAGLSPEDRLKVRKDKAERRADNITDREWGRITRTTAFERCLRECEEEFERRRESFKSEVDEAIDDFLA